MLMWYLSNAAFAPESLVLRSDAAEPLALIRPCYLSAIAATSHPVSFLHPLNPLRIVSATPDLDVLFHKLLTQPPCISLLSRQLFFLALQACDPAQQSEMFSIWK